MKFFTNLHIMILLNLILQSQLNAMDPSQCEPVFSFVELNENYKFLIVGSHGLWDAFSSEDAPLELCKVLPKMKAQDAASKIYMQ